MTPVQFRFALKANRYLTHNKKLAQPAPSIRIERNQARPLGTKLAVVLWQLPRDIHCNFERLKEFAQALLHWPRVRHAIEFRQDSWLNASVAECLRQRRIAVCQSDAADWPRRDVVSADFVCLRLHGREQTYASDYGVAALEVWSQRIRRWLERGLDVFFYFDNDALGHAPENAQRLKQLLKG